MKTRGLVLSDGAGATEIGVDQARAKVALYGPDGTTPIANATGADATDVAALPVSTRDRSMDRLRALSLDGRGSLNLGPLRLIVWDSIPSPAPTGTDPTYTASASTMTFAYTVEGYRFNSTASTGNGAFSQVITRPRFGLKLGRPLTYIARARVVPPRRPSGTTAGMGVLSEIGFTDSTAPGNSNAVGAYFSIENSVVRGVLVIAQHTSVSGRPRGEALYSRPIEYVGWGGQAVDGYLDPQQFYEWQVIVDPNGAQFIIRDSSGAAVYDEVIRSPPATARTWRGGITSLAASARHFNLGTPAAPGDLYLGQSAVGVYNEAFQNRSYPALMAEHRTSLALPTPPFTTQPTWANSAEPASVTLTNTSGAPAGFGGKFQFAAIAGAATDYSLCANGNVTATFLCTGISIDTWITGAAVATTPTLIEWFLKPSATGSAVGNGSPTLGRFALGSQSFAIGTPIGGTPDRQIVRSFQSPLVLNSDLVGGVGRWMTLGLRIPVATATASQVIAGFVSIEGYWE